jgi:hypothetical protein
MSQESQHPRVVRIRIDDLLYESAAPTTGAALYALAHIPAAHELFKEQREDEDDLPIANDGMALPLQNGDRFRSRKPHTGTTIYVNTDPIVWGRASINYQDLVKLAFPDGPVDGTVRYSITWSKPDGSEGAVLKGGKVKVVDGMKFDVRNTDKS